MESGPNGLDDQDARQRQQKYGHNKLPEPPRPHPLWRFVLQFYNILIYVLLGAALITGLLQHYIDTGVILAVVLINAIIGVLQEGKAERAMDAIRQMLAPKASVMRNGKRTTLAGEELVPGDIVMLEAGDKVPADLRLIKCHDLQIQEAILTGESVAVEKQTDAVDENAALGTKAVWLAVILVTLGQFAITYLPILQTVFETEAVALLDGMIIIALGVMLFVCVEIEKQLRIRFSASGHF